ncbi:hypothetical protein DEIPH_ctg011orf0032 [Deinococcus phoenicis]|uniref:Terminase small subunit n=1 Tax=Deinococcus phoenicis TaxID=1476583 RepID=A0A016QSK6_9DEIO|nr:hypothetical protein [Deinococcus phoenicis]EYB69065.1 hypothetical protein DEIPH_ctg011orf0032 [Deinococcus phoenicis]
MANRTKLTQKKREDFLIELEQHGNVTRAARAIGIRRQYAYEVKAEDPIFSEAWDNALQEWADLLEGEADRRAFEGTVKGVWYKGEQVGEEKQFSDTLLMFRLKALRPDLYKERQATELTGEGGGPVRTATVSAALSPDDLEGLDAQALARLYFGGKP